MHRVIRSAPARDDLRGINDWLTAKARQALAMRTLEAFRSRAPWLEDFPRGGRPDKGGTRILRVYDTRYLVRYRASDDCAEVPRVQHAHENWRTDP